MFYAEKEHFTFIFEFIFSFIILAFVFSTGAIMIVAFTTITLILSGLSITFDWFEDKLKTKTKT